MEDIDLKEKIRARLEELGRSPITAAQKGGLERSYLRDYLNGKKRSIKAETYPNVAKALDWSVDQLLEGTVFGASRLLTPKMHWLRGSRVPVPQQEIIPGADLVGSRDFPIYGAAQGGATGHLIVSFDPIQTVRRPAILEGVRNAYGIRVDGDSMIPAFRPGDIALVHPHLLPEAGTDVVLYDHDPKTGDAEALIKHLTGFTDKLWKLEQYRPEKKFTEHRADWPICHRVVGRYDRRR